MQHTAKGMAAQHLECIGWFSLLSSVTLIPASAFDMNNNNNDGWCRRKQPTV